MHEGVLLFAVEFIDQGLHEGLGGHLEGKLEEDEQRERFALDVHPFPKGIGAQQHGVLVALEFLEHGAAAGGLALGEEGAFAAVEGFAHVVVNAVQIAVAGEEHHGAQIGGGQQLFEAAEGLVLEKAVLGLRQKAAHHQPGLAFIVERRGHDGGVQPLGIHQAEPALAEEILEGAAQGEGGGGEDDAGHGGIEHLVQLLGNVHGRVAERGGGVFAVRAQRVLDPEGIVVQVRIGQAEEADLRFGGAHAVGSQRFGEGVVVRHLFAVQAAKGVVEGGELLQEVFPGDHQPAQQFVEAGEGGGVLDPQFAPGIGIVAAVLGLLKEFQRLRAHAGDLIRQVRAVKLDLVPGGLGGDAFGEGGLQLVEEAGALAAVGLRKLVQKVGQIGVGKLQTQVARGSGHQVVGFVHHQILVFAKGGVFHLEVGQQQGVVRHHHRGGLDVLAQVHHIASGGVGAFASRAEIAVGADLAPDGAEAVAVEGGVFAHISGEGEHFPDEEVEQGLGFIGRNTPGLLHQEFLPAPLADVVFAPFHQRGLEGQRQHGLQLGQVLEKELFLQVLGVGGNHHFGLLAVGEGEGRNQIGKGFSHPGAGFHGQMFAAAEGVVDAFGHLHLAGPELEIGEFPREQAGGGEDFLDVEIHAGEVVFQHVWPGHLRRSGFFADEGVAALVFHQHAQKVVQRVVELGLFGQVQQAGVAEQGIVADDVFGQLHQQQAGGLGVRSGAVGVGQVDLKMVGESAQTVVRSEGQIAAGDLHGVPGGALDQLPAA